MPRTFQARPNRTDLALPGPAGPEPPGQPNGQAVAVPTGLPYGEAGALAGAQQALPVGPGSAPGGRAASPPPPGAAPNFQAGVDAAQNWEPPMMNLSAPTERPGEPVTAGLPTGAGPGPQAPFGGGPDPMRQAAAILNSLGASASPETTQLRAQINVALSNQAAP